MKSKTILVVDDMLFDRELLSKALSRKLACKIIQASSGDEALAILSSEKVNIVLLDVEMPNLAGDEVIQRIRKFKGQEELPIIMVSGKGQDEMVVRCLRSGANDFVTKPINFEVALTRIINHLALSEAILVRGRLEQGDALDAMIVTYNHELNNPLAIAFGFLEILETNRNDEASFLKLRGALGRIAETVRKIKEVSEKKEIVFNTYAGNKKMLKLS